MFLILLLLLWSLS